VSRRPPSSPPQIPGLTYLNLLGSGGFADVFLYEQELPRRKVAVKALLAQAVTPEGRAQFAGEANLMAQLSTHPSIVTIYQAATTEDGRPYLVMEYCPRPNLSARYRRERIGVAEALRIAVRLAGAVETAHRAGILHRDIKPANVLTTDYGWPALTDFGISVAGGSTDDTDQAGMSIPWAAPEFFIEDAPRGAAADVYALAATIYTLLAGRSPFEAPGQSNAALDLITRIERNPVPATGRDDVPEALEEILRRGMAKDPRARFSSAASFARAVQQVETELHLPLTPLDIPDAGGAEEDTGAGEDQRTRVRSINTISPNTSAPEAGPTRHRPAIIDPGEQTRQSAAAPTGAATGAASGTGAAPGTGAPAPAGAAAGSSGATPAPPPPGTPSAAGAGSAPSQGSRRRRTALITAAVAAVVVAVVVVMAIGAMNGPGSTTEPTASPSAPPPETFAASTPPPPVTGVSLTRSEDGVKVTWKAPEYDRELEFGYEIDSGGPAGMQPVGERTSVTLTDVSDHVCVTVMSIDAESRKISVDNEKATGCA